MPRQKNKQSLKCPDCRRVLKYNGNGKFECKNGDCSVIEVHVDRNFIISHVKRAVQLKNEPDTPFNSGICPVCGRIVERLGRGITVAFCKGGRRKGKHPPVEIKLKKGFYVNVSKQ